MEVRITGATAPSRSSRQPFEEAMALRWYLERARRADARPGEMLEYEASIRVLETMERLYPGLAGFVAQATSLAVKAAGANLARSSNAPRGVVQRLDEEVESELAALRARAKTLPTDDVESLLQSYIRIADVAGLLRS